MIFFWVALYCAVRAACHFQGEPFTVPKTIYLETKFQLVPGLGYDERLDMVIVGSSFFLQAVMYCYIKLSSVI